MRIAVADWDKLRAQVGAFGQCPIRFFFHSNRSFGLIKLPQYSSGESVGSLTRPAVSEPGLSRFVFRYLLSQYRPDELGERSGVRLNRHVKRSTLNSAAYLEFPDRAI